MFGAEHYPTARKSNTRLSTWHIELALLKQVLQIE
jgi:hypothetical protein